jgi:DNA repair exonuclease SbcCD ATPase subunit
MGHDSTTLDLPERGIVAVTGENGAGKSSLVEAVAWCGWGKTLREDVPWRGDAETECRAEMETLPDLLYIERARLGSKTTLEFSVPHRAAKHDTAKAAQADLLQSIGPFDLWRRTHVFSSHDATHFTLATDGERKRLIESFLGCDRFDPALEACRADLKVAQRKLDAATRQHEVMLAKLEAEQTRLRESKAALASAPSAREVKVTAGKPIADYDKHITELKREIYAIEQKLRMADRAGGEYEAAARSAKVMLERLRAAKCPTCAQDIPDVLRKAEQKKIDKANADAQAAKAKALQEVGDVEATIAELNAELEGMQAQRTERATQIRLEQQAQHDAERAASQRRQLEGTIKAATANIAQAKHELVEAEEEIDLATSDVTELVEVEKVLGLKGVRSHILGTSLSGIEAVANSWLARLRQGVQLELRPYSEKGPADAISLKVCGLGRGTYKSTSGGERRRVDVALLLALGEVASAAAGGTPGTLFFDEVFDCLDEPGVEGVCEVLAELAQTRAVVVITHSKPLIEKLRATRRMRIARGKVEALG